MSSIHSSNAAEENTFTINTSVVFTDTDNNPYHYTNCIIYLALTHSVYSETTEIKYICMSM